MDWVQQKLENQRNNVDLAILPACLWAMPIILEDGTVWGVLVLDSRSAEQVKPKVARSLFEANILFFNFLVSGER